MLLAEHFAINMANELSREYFPGFSEPVTAQLREYPWPGNIRELKNVIERCVYRHDTTDPVSEINFDPFDSPFRPLNEKSPDSLTSASQTVTAWPTDLKQAVQSFEIEMIEQAMAQAKHNQRKAAELLQLTYHQLRGYLKKYELVKND